MSRLETAARRVREDWGLALDSGWSLLTVTGPDRQSFLHALLSQDLRHLEVGQGAVSGFLDRKGHLRTDLLVHVADSEILLLVPTSRAEALRDGLWSFRITEQVEIESPPDVDVWLLSGPRSSDVLRAWGVSEPRGNGWALGHGRCLGAGSEKAWAVRARHTGERDVLVAVNKESARRLLDGLPSPLGEREIPSAVLDVLRLEAGLPGPRDIGEGRLPQELDLDDAVSLTKGCFLGQETMARLAHRGQLRNRLAGWILDGEGDTPALVFCRGALVGDVTSLLRGATVSGTLALGILRISARDLEADYRVGDPEGRTGKLVELPFVRGSGFDVDPRRLRGAAAVEENT